MLPAGLPLTLPPRPPRVARGPELATKPLAKITQSFVFINLGSLIAICIACLATCKDFHPVCVFDGTTPPVRRTDLTTSPGFVPIHNGGPGQSDWVEQQWAFLPLRKRDREHVGLLGSHGPNSQGILSVSWTMTDYDGTAHISEEIKRASIAAPAAIVSFRNSALRRKVLSSRPCSGSRLSAPAC